MATNAKSFVSFVELHIDSNMTRDGATNSLICVECKSNCFEINEKNCHLLTSNCWEMFTYSHLRIILNEKKMMEKFLKKYINNFCI